MNSRNYRSTRVFVCFPVESPWGADGKVLTAILLVFISRWGRLFTENVFFILFCKTRESNKASYSVNRHNNDALRTYFIAPSLIAVLEWFWDSSLPGVPLVLWSDSSTTLVPVKKSTHVWTPRNTSTPKISSFQGLSTALNAKALQITLRPAVLQAEECAVWRDWETRNSCAYHVVEDSVFDAGAWPFRTYPWDATVCRLSPSDHEQSGYFLSLRKKYYLMKLQWSCYLTKVCKL